MGAAPQAVTNYLAYVHGKAGKANPKLSKVYIGWVNQQGGQVVIGGLATAGASLAVDYINQYLGGVGGHPVQLVPCFIKSAEEEGTTCGQKFVNDKRISVVAEGAVATGAQSLHATIGATKPIVTGVAITPVNGASKTGVVLFGDGPHILLPFGNYAKNVLHAKTAAVVYPNAPGVAESGQVIAKGLKDAGIATKQVGYTQGQSDLTAPLLAAGAATADFIAPYGSASDCANQAKALKQLGITDSKKIVTAPLCLNKVGDRRARRLGTLDLRDRIVALRRSDRQGHARLRRGDQDVQGAGERSGSVAHRRVLRAPDDRPVPQRGQGNRQDHAGPCPREGEGVQGPARARPAEARVRQVQGCAGDLQRQHPGVHVQGQVRVHEGVRLDLPLGRIHERRLFIPTGPVNPAPSDEPHEAT